VMLYNREKRLDDAEGMLEELTKTYPQNSLFRLERAVTLAQLTHLKAASDAWKKAGGEVVTAGGEPVTVGALTLVVLRDPPAKPQ